MRSDSRPEKGLAILESVWVSGDEFLRHFSEDERTGRFFHPVEKPADLPAHAQPGELISVNLRFLYRNAEFHLHARVLERLETGESPGLRLELLPEERDRQDLVKACAQGLNIPYYERRFPRVACEYPARLELDDGRVLEAVTTNISEGGAGLRPDHALMIDMTVKLTVDFPKDFQLESRAQIVYVITQGPQRGLGVKFLYDSDDHRDQIEELIAWVRETF